MLFSLLSQRPYVWLGGNSSGLKLASTCVRDMRGEPLQDVFESRYRYFNYPCVDRLTFMSTGWTMRGQAVSFGQKALCFISVQFLKRASAKRHQFYLHATRGKTYLRRMGLPYARESIINQTATATSRTTQGLTKKSLLTAPYYHSLSCDMNIMDENSLNVVFSPGILYRAFENHAISRRGKMGREYRVLRFY